MEVTTRVTQDYLDNTIMIGEHKWTEQGHNIDETIFRTRNADVFYLKRVIKDSHGIFFWRKSDSKQYVVIYELTYEEAVDWTKEHLPSEAYDFYFVRYKTETNKWIQRYEETKERCKLENYPEQSR